MFTQQQVQASARRMSRAEARAASRQAARPQASFFGQQPAFEQPSANRSAARGPRSRVSEVVGSRPAGCPRGLFCACALSIKIFGSIRPELNLAANWVRRFSRTAPAPQMVAARSGHAFQLISHVSGSTWLVWDANSGKGRIRVHERSIAGYTIVDPGSSRMASL